MQNTSITDVSIEEFLSFIYGDSTGYCYLAVKNGDDWRQLFYEWPQQAHTVARTIQQYGPVVEVYYAPALFSEQSSKKNSVKESSVLWVEFDGNSPKNKNLLKSVPPPSARLRSSRPGHEHWYWRMARSASGGRTEALNRALTYHLGADSSGWDACQILRPPHTFNHKRDLPVEVISWHPERIYEESAFYAIPEPPKLAAIEIPTGVVPIQEVLTRLPVGESLLEFFNKGVEVGSRSSGLVALGCGFAEIGASDEELFSVLLDADSRWGKFKDRNDRDQRLLSIITFVREKVPVPTGEEELGWTKPYGFGSLLKLDIHVDWVWEGWLHQHGSLLLAGPPKVGKSQFSLDFAAKLALGKDHLGREVKGPRRVGFLSLEMGVVELKYFLELQANGYDDKELALLEENFLTFPVGHPISLSKVDTQATVEKIIVENQLDGLFIDSVGSVTEESLSGDKEVKEFLNWNDYVRQQHGCFTWWLHHLRKGGADNRRPTGLNDVFGSQYIGARFSSILCLWQGSKSLELIELAVRMAANGGSTNLLRDTNLHFAKKPDVKVTMTNQEDPKPQSLEKTVAPKDKEGKTTGSKGLTF